jgi:hypothetical protein
MESSSRRYAYQRAVTPKELLEAIQKAITPRTRLILGRSFASVHRPTTRVRAAPSSWLMELAASAT